MLLRGFWGCHGSQGAFRPSEQVFGFPWYSHLSLSDTESVLLAVHSVEILIFIPSGNRKALGEEICRRPDLHCRVEGWHPGPQDGPPGLLLWGHDCPRG